MSVTAAAGFTAAGVRPGIKSPGLDLALVTGTATVLTTDLTPDYVRFNGERS